MELVEAVASWQTLLLAVGVFGFAPGFILRLAVKIYPRDDPRRRELVAEMYIVPRLLRPFYVAEQIETVLFEGTGARLNLRRRRRALNRDLIHGFGVAIRETEILLDGWAEIAEFTTEDNEFSDLRENLKKMKRLRRRTILRRWIGIASVRGENIDESI
jgi:hypothetical protein